MKTKITSTVVYLLIINACFGQSRPFPQDVEYDYGFKPATISSDEAERTYNSWKNLLLEECNGMYRVASAEPEITLVEAIGFGMLLTAYYGDKEEFDGLFDFYKSKRTENANNMMAWRVTCDDIDDPGSATDGDVDVALSLIVAHYQWGEDYLDEALDVIEVIKNSVLVTCDDLLALGPGFSLQAGGDGRWGGCNLLDIMYHTPAFFRVFAEATGDTTWNTLADDTYVMLNASANEVTGLVPDWQSAGGMPGGDPPQPNRNPNYSYDACRVPWRIALDYLWNGNEEAKDWCKKVTNWADDIGAQNIVDGYTLDGEPLEGMRYHNNSFVGGFAVGAMCNSQTVADNFGTEMNSSTLRNDTYWFNLCTRAIYLFVMTGNFWKPEKLSSLNDRGIRAGEKVYPNPVFRGGTIFVEGIKGVDQIDILNLEGKIIKRITTTAQVKTEIRANLSPGYYFLRFLGLEDTLYVSLAVE